MNLINLLPSRLFMISMAQNVTFSFSYHCLKTSRFNALTAIGKGHVQDVAVAVAVVYIEAC